MTGCRPYTVTEWDWFRLRLELRSLNWRYPGMKVFFEFPGDDTIRCLIYSTGVQTFVDAHASRSEQAPVCQGWVRTQKALIANLLAPIPGLSCELDLAHNLVFDIMYDDGRSALPVCTIRGDEVKWH